MLLRLGNSISFGSGKATTRQKRRITPAFEGEPFTSHVSEENERRFFEKRDS